MGRGCSKNIPPSPNGLACHHRSNPVHHRRACVGLRNVAAICRLSGSGILAIMALAILWAGMLPLVVRGDFQPNAAGWLRSYPS